MATAREVLAGRAAVEISIRDKLKAGLDGAKQRLQNFAVSVAAIGISFQSLAGLARSAMATIGDVFTGPADQLQNLSDRTGLTVEILQALAESGADSGATLEDVGGAARAMANFLQQAERGGDGAAKTLADLGMSAEELAGMSQDQRLSAFADALAGIDDPARKAALAQDIFGRGAMSLLPILSQGSAGIDAFGNRLKEVGALKSGDAIAAADQIGDAIGRLGRRLKDVGFTALSAIAPALDKISAAAVGLVEAFNQFLSANPRIAQAFAVIATGAIAGAVALAALTGATIAAGMAAYALSTAWAVATAAIGAASAVMAIIASPIGIIVGLVAGLGIALVALGATLLFTTETGQTALAGLAAGFQALWSRVTQVLGGIFDALATGNLKLSGEIAMAGLSLAWSVGWGKIKTVTAEAIAWIGSKILDGMAFALDKLSTLIDMNVEGMNVILRSLGADEIEFRASNLVTAAELASDALRSGAAAYADDIKKGVDDAKKTLDDLTAQAAADRKKREDALKVPKIDGDGDKKDEAVDAGKVAAQLAVRGYTGTFSATVAGRLGMTTKIEDQIAQNTLDAAVALIEINRKIKAGKLAVAP